MVKVNTELDLEVSIEEALKYVENLYKTETKGKGRKPKRGKNRSTTRNNVEKKSTHLNSLVDELLNMKETERRAQLLRPIVPIEEWIGNEYYCGSEVFNLYPFWKKHLIAIYNSPVLINELILTGGLRNRKNYIR